ncbi:uncharacterized protein L203_103256 [Cryptococcus depauperatus CBS 7841]|uniref:Uncharacterized protein n=1 Tax=Cryptococcus depauperatus CBS 7841 TaxID=1295531 RepID=A0AAJ8JT91_9TREE
MDRHPSTLGSGNVERYLPYGNFSTNGDPPYRFHDNPTNCWPESKDSGIGNSTAIHRSIPPTASGLRPDDESMLSQYLTDLLDATKTESAPYQSTPGSFTGVGIGSVPDLLPNPRHGYGYSQNYRAGEIKAQDDAASKAATERQIAAVVARNFYAAASDSAQTLATKHKLQTSYLFEKMKKALKDGTVTMDDWNEIRRGLHMLDDDAKILERSIADLQKMSDNTIIKQRSVCEITEGIKKEWREWALSLSDALGDSATVMGRGWIFPPPPPVEDRSDYYDETSRSDKTNTPQDCCKLRF